MIHSLCVTALCLLVAGEATAGQTTNPDLGDLPLAELLAVRAVAASRHERLVTDSPRAITVVTGAELRERHYRTTPDALAEVVGVFVQQTNYGGGAPIIRGLVGNQLLILIDGIRLNTAAYRLGPNQYLNTIDINQIERIEVVRGAGSVLYGSGALGGVINIVTRRATTPADGERWLSTRVSSRLASADRSAVERAEVFGGAGPLRFIAGATLKEFGDVRGGSRTGLQPFTGYSEWDADAKLTVQPGKRQTLTLTGQRVSASEVRRSDLLQAGTELKNEVDPQRRDLLAIAYEARPVVALLNSINLHGWFQRQDEAYRRIAATSPTSERVHRDAVDTFGLGVQFNTRAAGRQMLTYGFEAHTDDVTSTREDVNLVTGKWRAQKSTLADGARDRAVAAFAQDEIAISRKLDLNLGLRYSRSHLTALVDIPESGRVDVDARSDAITGTAYALYRSTPYLSLTAGVSQGFRAPNVDDLTSFGDFGTGFDVPNPELRPETSLNYEAGVRLRRGLSALHVVYFHSDYTDLIQRASGTYFGSAFLDLNENGRRDGTEQLIFQRKNAGLADIQGVELEGRVHMSDPWMLSSQLAWTCGRALSAGEPLRRIPPINGLLKLAWRPRARVWAEGVSMFATKQTRLAAGDKTDPRIPVGGTPGFVTFNLRGGVRLNHGVRIGLRLENVTDQTFRIHGSGIDRPGRNVVAGIDWVF
jgi:outer membrane receptor protein involved in Fe transport